MVKFILTTWVLLMAAGVSQAAVLSGTVVDSVRQVPAVGVSVQVKALGVGTTTDSLGRFELVLPEGRHTVRLTHVGFVGRDIPGVFIGAHANAVRWALMPRVYERAPIDVVAAPVGEADLNRQPSFLTVLTRKDFEGQAVTMADVLAATPGVQVKRLGGMGAFSTVSIRGSSSEQVDVYLDGMPLNLALGGGVDLSTLPLAQVDQVQILRGAAAGEGGLGGTIHIRTRAAKAAQKAGVTASWGAYDTRGLSAMVGGGNARTGFIAVADYSSSDNNFPFLDDNGTEYNAHDDAVVPRRNSDFVSGNLLAKWRYTAETNRHFGIQENLFWKHQGMPGISNNQSQHARFQTLRSLTEATFGLSDLWNRFSLDQRLFAMVQRERFRDPDGEIGVGRQDNTYRTQTFGGHTRLSGAIGEGYDMSLEGELRYERFSTVEALSQRAGFPESNRLTADAGAGVDVNLPRKWGQLSFSARVSQLRDRLFEETTLGFTPLAPDTLVTRTLVNARAGVRLDVLPGVRVKANVGRSHRAPGFFELFGDRGGMVGNTALLPEHGISWDAGVQLGAQALEAVYFDQRYIDLIQFVQTSQGTSRPFNIGKARVRGVELSSRGRVGLFALSGNYTFQKAMDQSEVAHLNGKRLPGRPAHEVHVRGDVFWGRVTPFYDYTFEADNFLDRANLRPVPARQVHDVGVHVRVYRQAMVTVEAKNLFNSQIADQWGYPLPGRMFFVTVQESF